MVHTAVSRPSSVPRPCEQADRTANGRWSVTRARYELTTSQEVTVQCSASADDEDEGERFQINEKERREEEEKNNRFCVNLHRSTAAMNE